MQFQENLPIHCESLSGSTAEKNSIFNEHVCIYEKGNLSTHNFAFYVEMSFRLKAEITVNGGQYQ